MDEPEVLHDSVDGRLDAVVVLVVGVSGNHVPLPVRLVGINLPPRGFVERAGIGSKFRKHALAARIEHDSRLAGKGVDLEERFQAFGALVDADFDAHRGELGLGEPDFGY